MAERDAVVGRVERVVQESWDFISNIKDLNFQEMAMMMTKAYVETLYWRDHYEMVVPQEKRVESYRVARLHS